MNFVLGISGRAGVGKDAAADFLVASGWTGKLAFANNLKRMCMKVFDLTEYDVFDQVGKSTPIPGNIKFNHDHCTAILTWMQKTHGENLISKIKLAGLVDMFGTLLSTPRDVLQFVGTDVCRFLIPTYHLDVVGMEIAKSPGKWVISDVRFPNEAEFITKELGGQVLNVVGRKETTKGSQSEHSSENSLSGWDGFFDTIINDEVGLDVFYRKISDCLERIVECQDTQSKDEKETTSSP